MDFERVVVGGGKSEKLVDMVVQGSFTYPRLYVYLIIFHYIIILMGSTRP
jgi:hypothetical protein